MPPDRDPRPTTLHRRAALALATAAIALAAAPAHAAAAPVFGFNESWTGSSIALSASDGAQVDRVFVKWSTVEPAPGAFNWEQEDNIARAMGAAGIRPLWVVIGAPGWAAPAGCGGDACPPAKAHDKEFQRFTGALTARYPSAIGVEIWNEPNWGRFWAPKANPERYTAVLRSGYRGVKGANPGMPVISGGLAGNLAKDTVRDTVFLKRMYKAGARSYMDAIGTHLYPGPSGGPPVFAVREGILNPLRRIRDRYGDRAKPLWVTEFGQSTTGPGGLHYHLSEEAQGDHLAAIYRALANMPDIGAAIVFRLLDGTGGPAAFDYGLGVAHPDGSPKYAAVALRDAIANPSVPDNPLRLTATPNPARVDQPIALGISGYVGSGAGSGTVSYKWDFRGRGFFGRDTGGTPGTTYDYNKARSYRVRVRAIDSLDIHEVSGVVRVGRNNRPVARILATPAPTGGVVRTRVGRRVRFNGRRSSADSGTRVKQYSWYIQKEDHRYHSRFHRRSMGYTWRKAGRYRVKLKVRDTHGNTGFTILRVRVSGR